MAKQKQKREVPAAGGHYRRDKNGTLKRLDQPQKPDPGSQVRRKRTAKAKTADSKSAAKDSESTSKSAAKGSSSSSNVSQLPPKGEKE